MKNRKKLSTIFYVAIGLSMFLLIVYQFVDVRDAWDSFFICLIVWDICVLLGICIFVVATVLCLMKKLFWKDLAGIFVAFLLSFFVVNFLSWGQWYTSFRYDLSLDELKEAVTQINEGELVDFDDGCDVEGLCYKGTLVEIDGEMIVFMTEPGIIDNWGGIVYDPTGLIKNGLDMKYNPSVWDDPEFKDLKMIFGGDLTGCFEIEEDWYDCSFT